MKPTTKFLIGTLSALMMGCGGGGQSDPVADGWAFFTSGQYGEAHTSFVTAVEAGNPEGYVGLGWVCIDLDSLPEAGRYFSLAAADNFTDGYAGWSAVLWANGNYADCITKADFVLQNDPSYSFDFRPTVNYKDMIWYQASGYLHLGNFSQCLERIQELDGSFTTDVNAVNAGDLLAAKLETLAGQLAKQMRH